MKETDLVRVCLQLLWLRGVLAWRQNQGAVTAMHNGRTRFFRFAGIKGISDILGVLPGGQFIAVECKVGKNVPTDEQAAFMERVREQGGVAVLAYSVEDLIGALDRAPQHQGKAA